MIHSLIVASVLLGAPASAERFGPLDADGRLYFHAQLGGGWKRWEHPGGAYALELVFDRASDGAWARISVRAGAKDYPLPSGRPGRIHELGGVPAESVEDPDGVSVRVRSGGRGLLLRWEGAPPEASRGAFESFAAGWGWELVKDAASSSSRLTYVPDGRQWRVKGGADGGERLADPLAVARMYWSNLHDPSVSRQTALNRAFLLAAADGMVQDSPAGFAAWMVENSRGRLAASPVFVKYMRLAEESQAEYEAELERPRKLEAKTLATGEILYVRPSEVSFGGAPANHACPPGMRSTFARYRGSDWLYCEGGAGCPGGQVLLFSFHPWSDASRTDSAGYASATCAVLGPKTTL